MSEHLYHDLDLEEMDDILKEYGIANEAEIKLVCNINGYNEHTLLNILYARTGLNSFQQLFKEYKT